LDRTNKRSFIVVGFNLERFLVSVFPASKKFDSDLKLDAPMPTMNNNIAPMPTQNPWAWAWVRAPNVGLWREPTARVEASITDHLKREVQGGAKKFPCRKIELMRTTIFE
jgi:hypothetical protein